MYTIFIFLLLIILVLLIKNNLNLQNTFLSHKEAKIEFSTENSPILKNTFEEAITDLAKFNSDIAKEGETELNKFYIEHLSSKNIQNANEIKSTFKKLKKTNQIEWTISNNTNKKLATYTAYIEKEKNTGKILPVVKDSKGKYLEQFKGKKISKLSKTAKLGNVIVNAAHIISNADAMKKLKIIDKKLDLLIAFRQIDQLSNLESNYMHAREILQHSIEQDKLSTEDIIILKESHQQVMQIRSVWIGEMNYKIQEFKNPNDVSFLKWIFSSRKGRESTMQNKVPLSEFELQLQLIEFTLAYNLTLSQYVSSSDSYINLTLPSDLKKIKDLISAFKEKNKYITVENSNNPLEKTIDRLENLYKRYIEYSPIHKEIDIDNGD